MQYAYSVDLNDSEINCIKVRGGRSQVSVKDILCMEQGPVLVPIDMCDPKLSLADVNHVQIY